MVRKSKWIAIILVMVIFIAGLSSTIYAATDSAGVFGTSDIASGYAPNMSGFTSWIFQGLSYNVTHFYNNVSNKSTVTSYLTTASNNYGFSLSARVNGSWNPVIGSTTLTKGEISGNWHLVILNFPYSGVDNSWANAFKTVGYTSRGFLGWSSNYAEQDISEWAYWVYYCIVYANSSYPTLRDKALYAAAKIPGSGTTPIKMYGDTSWSGVAW